MRDDPDPARMTIRQLIRTLLATMAVLAVISAVLIIGAAGRRRAMVALQQKQFRSYQLGDELRHSSDDLTRFARTYVVTGDAKYERYYREVIAIREGKQPRPAGYQHVYWDLHITGDSRPLAAGRAVPLLQLMEEEGFSADELRQLRTALAASDSLVKIEETAIHAVKGLYRDANGAFTRKGPPDQALAIRIMFGAAYHSEKVRIMAPIDSFLARIDTRSSDDLNHFLADTSRAFVVITAVFGLFLLVVLASFPILRGRILKPVGTLQTHTAGVASDLGRLAQVSTQIAQGDLTQSFATATKPLGSKRRDEIGDLSRLHDTMLGQLQETGGAIGTMTAELHRSNAALGAHVTELEEIQDALRDATRAAEAAANTKAEFLAHMSHEIRTPMNAILGYAQLLRVDANLQDSQRRKLDAILSSGDHLLGLINGVLEMSRIEAGRAALSMESFDLSDLLETVRSMFLEQFTARGIMLDVRLAPDIVRLIESDPGKVRQVLINLVGNALKFTERGGIAVRASTQELTNQQVQVTIEVEDTGSGISAADQERIFAAFEQTAGGARRGGTGLGLAISRSFARMLGGDLAIRSTPGQGSTFTFTFIAARADTRSTVEPRATTHARPSRLDPAETSRIALVVDDVATNRDVLEEVLTRAGFIVHTATTGEEGIEIHDREHPDVVLMDLHMPGIGGFEAIRRLRAAKSTAVIVVTTASTDAGAEAASLAAGARALIRKPYRDADLLQLVGRLLKVKMIEVDQRPITGPRRVVIALGTVLRQIPTPLANELREAALQARAATLVELADRVAPYSSDAAEDIRRIADEFQYHRLLDALDEVEYVKP